MIPSKLTKRTAFRIAVLFAAFFVLAMTLIFGFLYLVISADLDQYLKDHVDEIQSTLADVGETGGRDALATMVSRHAAVAQTEEDIYLLTDRAGAYLAGNIKPIERFEGWKTLPWSALPLIGDWTKDRKSTAVIGHWTEVKDGHLFVADGNGDINDAQEILLDGLKWGVALAALASILGGLALGFGAQRRVDVIEQTLDAVAHGELDRRVTLSNARDDLDHVAELMNTTLDRLQRLILSMKQVTTDIAHDLKTPISRIRQQLETVHETARDVEECRSAIGKSLGDLDCIVDTFEALLRIAEIEGGARKAQFNDVDLKTVLADVTEALEPVAEERGQRLFVGLGGQGPAPIKGDKQLLNQLFVNLIENAIRHCPQGSRIAVALARTGSLATVSIADNGPGIPLSERDKVFQRLYRLEKSRTTPGSGLGLSLAEAIAKLHDASITLHDNRPGLEVRLGFPSESAAAG